MESPCGEPRDSTSLGMIKLLLGLGTARVVAGNVVECLLSTNDSNGPGRRSGGIHRGCLARLLGAGQFQQTATHVVRGDVQVQGVHVLDHNACLLPLGGTPQLGHDQLDFFHDLLAGRGI